jgi:hypothetical protein
MEKLAQVHFSAESGNSFRPFFSRTRREKNSEGWCNGHMILPPIYHSSSPQET